MSIDPDAIPATLRELRRRTQMSQREIADALGLGGGSSYGRYEKGGRVRRFLPLDHVMRLADLWAGRGEPPIARYEVMQLAGIDGQLSRSPGDADRELVSIIAATAVQGIMAAMCSAVPGLTEEQAAELVATATGLAYDVCDIIAGAREAGLDARNPALGRQARNLSQSRLSGFLERLRQTR